MHTDDHHDCGCGCGDSFVDLTSNDDGLVAVKFAELGVSFLRGPERMIRRQRYFPDPRIFPVFSPGLQLVFPVSLLKLLSLHL